MFYINQFLHCTRHLRVKKHSSDVHKTSDVCFHEFNLGDGSPTGFNLSCQFATTHWAYFIRSSTSHSKVCCMPLSKVL